MWKYFSEAIFCHKKLKFQDILDDRQKAQVDLIDLFGG